MQQLSFEVLLNSSVPAEAELRLGQQESDFSLRTLLVLLDHRIEQNLATFVTTNKTIEDLAWSFDQRVASRLRQACEIVEIRGADRRI